MSEIQLKYGQNAVPFAYSEDRFEILRGSDESQPFSDIEIGEAFDSPINSSPLEDLVEPGQTVLFVVPDATRQAAAGQIVNLLVRRLIANGTMPHEMAVIFATGIHRKVTDDEREEILTPFIAQRLKTIDHDPRNLVQIVRLGETSGGISVELNRALVEFDHVVTIGSISFHYFAGFTGGRKLICPGLASAGTIAATHRLAFDCENLDRRSGVGPGKLEGNPVHEAFVEAAAKVRVSFAVNSIVNALGEATSVYCGDPIASHENACEVFALANTMADREKRDLVIVSCGGSPFDVNMIQAHKALDTAAGACSDGGTIILLAECSEGLGRVDFLDWFSVADSRELASRICAKYKVNGQTAWSLLKKAERFDVRIVTELDDETLAKMRLRRTTINELNVAGRSGRTGYIIPYRSKINLIVP